MASAHGIVKRRLVAAISRRWPSSRRASGRRCRAGRWRWICRPASPCSRRTRPAAIFILVCEGQVRVYQLDAEGNEIVLYRIGPGGMCILTTLALLADQSYSAFAVTETPVERDRAAGGDLPRFDGAFGAVSPLRVQRPGGADGGSDAGDPARRVRFDRIPAGVAAVGADLRQAGADDHPPAARRRNRHRAGGGEPASEGLRKARLGQPRPRPGRAAQCSARCAPRRRTPAGDFVTDAGQAPP